MDQDASPYGVWWMVAINSAAFIIFALSFSFPRLKREWRSFGGFAAFVVALFTEMHGFPLTIYLLSGWLGTRAGTDPMRQSPAHFWHQLFGLRGNPDSDPFHKVSALFIGVGFLLLVWAWRHLFTAQKTHAMTTGGPYQYVRHPQYVAFVFIMFGFLLQWPTLLTAAMFPILVYMYVLLARQEERDSLAAFGDAYARYCAVTPSFIPRFGRTAATPT